MDEIIINLDIINCQLTLEGYYTGFDSVTDFKPWSADRWGGNSPYSEIVVISTSNSDVTA